MAGFSRAAAAGACATVLIAASIAVTAGDAPRPPARTTIEITALSTDPARVTGGNVLVRISLPSGTRPRDISVRVGSHDLSSAFRPGGEPDTLVGLVTGLAPGRHAIEVSAAGRLGASLAVTNYPITGPVISGPWLQPFICQTDVFVLPDGSRLGPPLDANCSARTVVQYVYRPQNVSDPKQLLKPLDNLSALPSDVARTTTVTGEVVNFVVRVETGTMNRGIYQNAILHDPTVDPPPSPFTPPKGWNRRLVAMHGVGCPGGWFIQGGAQGANILDPARLGEGYALFINTLNHPSNSCNAFLAGETTMMGKEHFIETFGVPSYTISVGASGGAYTSLQVADAFPGLIDGVEIRATFPDALSIALSGLDAHLLLRYFITHADSFTEAQQVAASGYHGMQAFIDAANQSQRTDPVPGRRFVEGYQAARWNDAVPPSLRYDPVKNPGGARPTIFDAARNIYSVNSRTGAARRPFDNVGVQYGLSALESGAITPRQFLDLNEHIGGFDEDGHHTASRSAGDPGAIKRAYQSGLSLGANGGLRSIPIVDNATSNEESRYHYGWFHFALRERVRQANGGSSDNMVMWRSTSGASAQPLLDRWMAAVTADASSDPPRVKMIRAKPKAGVDGCYDRSVPPRFVADVLPFSRQPVSTCTALYPVYSNPRKEAGGPLAADVLKCQLKRVDPKDYRTSFSREEIERLKRVFPTGVCDWSKPGVNQVPVVPWASFGPSPVNRIGEH